MVVQPPRSTNLPLPVWNVFAYYSNYWFISWEHSLFSYVFAYRTLLPTHNNIDRHTRRWCSKTLYCTYFVRFPLRTMLKINQSRETCVLRMAYSKRKWDGIREPRVVTILSTCIVHNQNVRFFFLYEFNANNGQYEYELDIIDFVLFLRK